MATSAHLRHINRRRILESILRVGRVSRSELARASGMSQPTVSRIVDELLSQGILVQSSGEQAGEGNGAARSAAVGRPSTPLELDRRKPRYLVVQLGVRETRLAAMPVAIPDRDDWPIAFGTAHSAARWQRSLASAARRLPQRGIDAIAISVPGVMDEAGGRVFLSPNLRWTEKADLGSILGRVFGVPVLFVQEIRALALGHRAVEPGATDFLLVDLGSGVGAAAVSGGTLYRGPLPMSGELGHTPVLDNPRRCGCGLVGCVETLLSRDGLLASAREHRDGDDWASLAGRIADRGLPDWMKRSLDAGAVAIASALNVLGQRSVVITGSLAELPAVAMDHLRGAVQSSAMWARFGTVQCQPAPRRRMAGLISVAIDRTLLNRPG